MIGLGLLLVSPHSHRNETTFQLPAGQAGVILEEITVRNGTDKAVAAADFKCGFAKRVHEGDAWLPDAGEVRFCPVPYRREMDGTMREFPLWHIPVFWPGIDAADKLPLPEGNLDIALPAEVVAFGPFTAPESGRAIFRFGADSWYEAYLDGDVISETFSNGSGNVTYPPTVRDHVVVVDLPRGEHLLAVRFMRGQASALLAVGDANTFWEGSLMAGAPDKNLRDHGIP